MRLKYSVQTWPSVHTSLVPASFRVNQKKINPPDGKEGVSAEYDRSESLHTSSAERSAVKRRDGRPRPTVRFNGRAFGRLLAPSSRYPGAFGINW